MSERELALFGARPAFEEPLFVGRPNMGDRERFLARMGDILDRRWFTNDGKYVQELEAALAAFLGVRHCVTVCNATVGLELAARALGLSGEVIVPSFTFVATAHALQWQQITPVFCDVDPATHNLDPRRVEESITPRTTGIVGVHVWGRPCAIDALGEIARRRGLKLLFDAAHALGNTWRGRRIGGFGDAEVFSFHATKFVNSFEGGAITTDDDDLAKRLRLMRNFGFAGYDNVVYVGTNGKMSEPSAAMGLTSLESLPAIVEVNRRNHEAYRQGLGGLRGLRVAEYDPAESNNYQYVVAELDAEEAGLSRDDLLEVLHAENVLARRYFHPGCHRMEPYRSYFPHARLLLPETERLTERVLSFPNGTAVAPAQIATICEVVRAALARGGEVSSLLAARRRARAVQP
jgi:dTDP-4-amino-4,6-dideoxygalactose transaminase